jgi:hypothetical protein
MNLLKNVILCLALMAFGGLCGASFALRQNHPTVDGTFESYMQATSVARSPTGFEVWLYAGSKDASKCGGPFATLEQAQIFHTIECCDMVKIHEEIK